MTPEQLQAIKDQWNDINICVHPEALNEINRLLAEVRRMRCCGNCREYCQRRGEYCEGDGPVKCDKWEAVDNG